MASKIVGRTGKLPMKKKSCPLGWIQPTQSDRSKPHEELLSRYLQQFSSGHNRCSGSTPQDSRAISSFSSTHLRQNSLDITETHDSVSRSARGRRFIDAHGHAHNIGRIPLEGNHSPISLQYQRTTLGIASHASNTGIKTTPNPNARSCLLFM